MPHSFYSPLRLSSLGFGILLFVSGCATRHFPTAAISNLPTEAYAIFSADKSVLKRGEWVQLTLSLRNPTGRPIPLPATNSDVEEGRIAGMLSAQWAEPDLPDGHYMGADISSFSTDQGGVGELLSSQNRDYHMRWKSPFSGAGKIDLDFEFEFDGPKKCHLQLLSK